MISAPPSGLRPWASALLATPLPCCAVMCGMLYVITGESVFSSVLASVDIREIGLYEVSCCLCLVLG